MQRRGKRSVCFRREGWAGLVPRRGEKRLEGGVRKTTHAGQTVWKTVAEEECVECVTT